jgi:hypothetical protein
MPKRFHLEPKQITKIVMSLMIVFTLGAIGYCAYYIMGIIDRISNPSKVIDISTAVEKINVEQLDAVDAAIHARIDAKPIDVTWLRDPFSSAPAPVPQAPAPEPTPPPPAPETPPATNP